MIEPSPAPVPRGAAVEFEIRVPPSGMVIVVSGRQAVTMQAALAGRVLMIWADLHSIHLILDGHVLRTVASRLLPQDLAFLAMRGARPAGPPPAAAALPRRDGAPVLAAGQAIEVDRKVHRDGHVQIGGEKYQVGPGLAGTTVTLRLDGHLMHAIADGALAGTWPCPLTGERAARLAGARAAATPLPPPPLPAGSIAARRRVHASGRIMVNRQPIKLGPRHAGKLVTVIIEDTCYRILHGEDELAIKPRRDTTPSPGSTSAAKALSPADRQASPENESSSIFRDHTSTCNPALKENRIPAGQRRMSDCTARQRDSREQTGQSGEVVILPDTQLRKARTMRATTKGITFPRITCPGCGRTVTKRRTDGLIRHHRTPDGHPCSASGIDPGGQALLTIQVPAFLLIRLAEASTDQIAAQEARMLIRKAQDTGLTGREAV